MKRIFAAVFFGFVSLVFPFTVFADQVSSQITGSVKLSWTMRGGTCNIRYTEHDVATYHYFTTASCDDGVVRIEGLVPGKTYKFQVSQNNWSSWTTPVTAKAKRHWRGMTTRNAQGEMRTQLGRLAGVNGDGGIHVEWQYRGGTCFIQYTEADQQQYKYSTSTACDDGGIWIKELIPGRAYRLQVNQDWRGWSAPHTAVAKNIATQTATITTAPQNTASVQVNWDSRGGTCNIRYTEDRSPAEFQYTTSAACDEGGKTISGLVAGQRYIFEVAKDGQAWSSPVTATAQ